MSCIVYQIDKKTGTKYAYESESYWDPEKQQPRSRRKYLGKVDPETGEIVTRKKKVSVKKADETEITSSEENRYLEFLKEKDEKISSLEKENNRLRQEKKELLSSLSALCKKFSE